MSEFIFGVLADIQYADKENGSFDGRVQRYREVPRKLEAAVESFLQKRLELSFIVALGDVIDGHKHDVNKSMQELEMIAGRLDPLAASIPVHHVVGNHCLSVPRQALLGRLGMPASYYHVSIAPGWGLVALDTTEMSPHSGYSEDTWQAAETRAFQAAHPMSDDFPHMHDWNGGLTSRQLQWLEDTLNKAQSEGEKILVVCHHPLGRGSSPDEYLAWNHEEVVDLLTRHSCVKAVLHGHYHPGGYCCLKGVHYITVEGLLEAPVGSNAFGFITVSGDVMTVEGHGVMTPRELRLR